MACRCLWRRHKRRTRRRHRKREAERSSQTGSQPSYSRATMKTMSVSGVTFSPLQVQCLLSKIKMKQLTFELLSLQWSWWYCSSFKQICLPFYTSLGTILALCDIANPGFEIRLPALWDRSLSTSKTHRHIFIPWKPKGNIQKHSNINNTRRLVTRTWQTFQSVHFLDKGNI